VERRTGRAAATHPDHGATVVIGGLATSTLLSLFVLPALYRTFAREA
jgi:multidrug efflux pump subunit AcrB